ncbi:MAG: SDR family NAD(P)-dependent oxidoreductase [Acidobacteria bacterium]|nr:MAG: SDR family NAD(P)-dependent oxidoreductase [Acidobacteriota bacterium]REK07811.1 MAG: SDR family NAD(P)-dependent oxidoreductase [Acidobacteriota bacterium]
MSRDLGDQVVLITGASTGIGLALARRLLQREKRLRLVLTAREESLPRFAAAGIEADRRVMVWPLDVTVDAQRRAAIAAVSQRWGGVDVLVNNAGVAYRSVLEHVREDERLEQMAINFLAPIELVRLVLPRMRTRRAGRILQVSSVGGMMAMPTMAIYSASKFALEGATEALWYEVRPWNVRVTLIEPGFIRSEGVLHTRYTRDSQRAEQRPDSGYHHHYVAMRGFIERLMARSWATPESVARRMHRCMTMRRPPLRYQVTADAHFFSLLRRLLPRGVYHRVLYAALPGIRKWGRPAG